MRHPSEWEGTEAKDLEDAALRFIESAAVIKKQLTQLTAGTQLQDQMMIFALEATLHGLNMGYEIITGEDLPEEYRLDADKHFPAI